MSVLGYVRSYLINQNRLEYYNRDHESLKYQAVEMPQQEKVLVTKPEDLSFNPWDSRGGDKATNMKHTHINTYISVMPYLHHTHTL